VQNALAAGLLPVVYGDVAFDEGRGGTIISTEEVMDYLAQTLRPSWLLLAGETEGVYDQAGDLIPAITPTNFEAIRPALGGSRGTDVTGGMASKVQAMLDLVQAQPGLTIRIFSGLKPGNLQSLLQEPERPIGTIISQFLRE
jgi:isopentenyl phosphate kinase